MDPARTAAALAAALVGVLISSPAWAENDYEQAKDLVELRWYDMAERLLKKTSDKSEAALGAALLAKGRADATTDLLQKRKFYKEALSGIAEYRNVAGKDHSLQGECLALEGVIQQALARTGNDIYRQRGSLKMSEEELKEIQAEIQEATKEANKNLVGSVAVAEEAYANAVKDYVNPVNSGQKWENAKRAAFIKYAEASQNYLNILLRNADKLDQDSHEQKDAGTTIAAFVSEWMKKQREKYHDAVDEGDDRPAAEYAGMWIYMKYALGRGLALAGKVDDGSKELEKVINEIDPVNFADGLPRQFATHYKTKCIYYRARAWADKALLSKADADWQKAMQSSWHEIFAGAPGTDPVLMLKSRVLKGECHWRMGQFTQAVEEFDRALNDIDKAQKDYQDSNGKKGLKQEICDSLRFEAYQALAEALNKMRGKGIVVMVPPEALVEAARASYRQEKYEDAIGCLRDAIARARKADIAGDWAKRLVIGGEPTAWLMMGNAYHRMGDELEAQLAYEGALLAFWGENGQAIPDDFRKKNPALIERLKAEILNSCVRNGRIAASAERQASPSKFNTSQVRMWLKWQVRLDPASADDGAFYEALMIYDGAKTLADEARALERAGRAAEAREKKAEALQDFAEAETKFLDVPVISPSREEAIYLAGMCCYEAMSLVGAQRGGSEDDKVAVSEMAGRALKHFNDYKAFVADTPPRPRAADAGAAANERQEIERRRVRNKAVIDLTVPFVHFECQRYADALSAAEKLRERTDLEAAQQDGLHQILFKCYIEVGLADADLGGMKGLLQKAENEVGWFKERIEKAKDEDKERYKRIYYNLAGRMGGAYYKAYDRARRAGNEQLAREFYGRQGACYDIVNQDPANQTIDGLGRTAKIFYELGNYAKARENYDKLLKFDTRGDRTRVPDDKLVSFDKLKNAVRGADFPTVEMVRLAKRKLDAIKTAVLGSKVEVKDQAGQVSVNEVPKDYDRALALISNFLDEYKGYDLTDGKPGDARKGLEILKEEIEFRLKMMRASNEITTCYVALGKELLGEKNEAEAKENFRAGLANAESALKLWPRDAELIFNKAFCQLASGEKENLEEAVKTLGDLRRGTRYGGELWWRATKAYTQTLIELGRLEEARGLVVQILLSSDQDTIKFNWPEIEGVATSLGEKMFPGVTGQDARDKLLGDQVKMPSFSYIPKSELEKQVDLQINALHIDRKNGKVNEKDAKFKEDLLRELVRISKDNPSALKSLKDPIDSVVILILNDRIRSLRNLGGISQGEEKDRFVPELKTVPAAPQEEPAKDADKTPDGKAGPAPQSGIVRRLAAALCTEGQA